jgi:DNA-binding response OmpR family regulator
MGRTVLVADDDPATQQIVRLTLEGAGYEVTAVRDGEETLRALETRVPDVVVLDVMMPKVDGLSVLRRIRDDPRTAQVPVVLLSACSSPDDLWRGWQGGVDYYLTKPLDCQELLRFMNRTVHAEESRMPSGPPLSPAPTSGRHAGSSSGGVPPEGPEEPQDGADTAAEPPGIAGAAVDSLGPAPPGAAEALGPTPAGAEPPVAAPVAAAAAAAVLVVDDDPFIQKVLRLNLELEGYAVTTASDGEEALERLAGARPDLVVLDVMMPGLDGLEVLRRIRESPETADLPVILLTARGSEEDMWEGWQRGVDYYLTKPFDIEDLLRSMDRLLSPRPAGD